MTGLLDGPGLEVRVRRLGGHHLVRAEDDRLARGPLFSIAAIAVEPELAVVAVERLRIRIDLAAGAVELLVQRVDLVLREIVHPHARPAAPEVAEVLRLVRERLAAEEDANRLRGDGGGIEIDGVASEALQERGRRERAADELVISDLPGVQLPHPAIEVADVDVEPRILEAVGPPAAIDVHVRRIQLRRVAFGDGRDVDARGLVHEVIGHLARRLPQAVGLGLVGRGRDAGEIDGHAAAEDAVVLDGGLVAGVDQHGHDDGVGGVLARIEGAGIGACRPAARRRPRVAVAGAVTAAERGRHEEGCESPPHEKGLSGALTRCQRPGGTSEMC
ncbi:MAG: hypothetical protein QM820_33170 [Minicystis sp.]